MEHEYYHHRHIFINRKEAGKELGEYLKKRNFLNPFIFALPRGGVPVADEVSKVLQCPLDVVLVRKIGAPGHEEYGIGAISEDERPFFNPEIRGVFDTSRKDIQDILTREREELRRRKLHYRPNRKITNLAGKSVILIDDGLATGITAAAAGRFLKQFKPSKLILAVPIGPQRVSEFLQEEFDEIICLHTPPNFSGVGLWYEDFNQVEDQEVMKTLREHYPETRIS